MARIRETDVSKSIGRKEVPFKSLHVDHSKNHRKDYGSNDTFFSFMGDIGRRGLDINLVCELPPEGAEDKVGSVIAGFRRSKAVETINLFYKIAKAKMRLQEEYKQLAETDKDAAEELKKELEEAIEKEFGVEKTAYFEVWRTEALYPDGTDEEDKKEIDGIIYGQEAVLDFYNLSSFDEEFRGLGKVVPEDYSNYVRVLEKWVANTEIVPIVLKKGSSSALDLDSLLENIQRKELNAIEEAEAFANIIAKLVAQGHKKTGAKQYLARKIGRSSSFIDQRLRLVCELVPEARAVLLAGEMTETQAYVISLGDNSRQMAYVEKAKKGMTTGALRRLICSDKDADPSRKRPNSKPKKVADKETGKAPELSIPVGNKTISFRQSSPGENQFVLAIDGDDRVHIKTTAAGYLRLSNPAGGNASDVLTAKTSAGRVVITHDPAMDMRFLVELDDEIIGAIYLDDTGRLEVEQDVDSDSSSTERLDDDPDDIDSSDEALVKRLLDDDSDYPVGRVDEEEEDEDLSEYGINEEEEEVPEDIENDEEEDEDLEEEIKPKQKKPGTPW